MQPQQKIAVSREKCKQWTLVSLDIFHRYCEKQDKLQTWRCNATIPLDISETTD
jgi:hypothetical protein